MAFYYVRNDGTATGDGGRYASQQTGDWDTTFPATTSFYAEIADALVATTPPVSGDFILVSSIHASTATVMTYDTVVTAYPPYVVSVDDTAMENSLAGGDESANSGADMDFSGSGSGLSIHGMSFTVGDDVLVGTNSKAIFDSCTITFSGTGDQFALASDAGVVRMINTDVVYAVGTTSAVARIQGGAYFEMTGGSITATSSTLNDLVGALGGNGGLNVRLEGVDLDQINGYLLGGTGGTHTSDDGLDVVISNCRLGSTLDGNVEEAFTNANHRFLMTNSSDTSAAAEYQFYLKTWTGDLSDQDDTGIHRDESTAFPSGTKVSMAAVTNANASTANPFIFDLPARYAELATASTDTIRLYFAVATATTLTDTNCWAELLYPDGTSQNLSNYLTNRNSDILATGTTHTDDSGASTWMDGGSALTSHNEYRMDLDTSGDVGADSVPVIRIYVGVPSVTVYFDTTVDVVA